MARRHQFSGRGLLLAVVALFGGWGFLAPYLVVQGLRCEGDVVVLLLGEERAAAR